MGDHVDSFALHASGQRAHYNPIAVDYCLMKTPDDVVNVLIGGRCCFRIYSSRAFWRNSLWLARRLKLRSIAGHKAQMRVLIPSLVEQDSRWVAVERGL